MLSRPILLLFAATLAGCTYPDYASGRAPDYPSDYQPGMGGYANDWPAQPGAQWGPQDVSGIEVFRDALSPHGRWLQSPQWGVVFVPNAQRGWRPYQNGQWLENRFWLSGDPWGWATDHYGRWGFDQQVGWVWVPGVTWGPSWVAWREADEAVGWAPIPPRVNWNVGVGFGGGHSGGFGHDNWNSWYAPSWVWVPRRNLHSRGFGGRIYPWNTGRNWWGQSRWQHTPYWGWNQPWDRDWGWRAPGRGWNGNQGWNRGWDNDWNGGRNNGWNGGWNGGNGGRWNDGRWNDRRRDGPRRGQPGSVGDHIGRDMTQPQLGQPQPGQPQIGQPQPGWNGGNRGDDRPARNADGGWNGRRNDGLPRGGVSDRVAGGMAPPPQQQPQQPKPRPERQGLGGGGGGGGGGQPSPNFQPRPESRPEPRSEPRNEPRNEPRGDGGQRMNGNDPRSNSEGHERPQ